MKHRKALLAIIGVVAVAVVAWLIYRAYGPPRKEVIKIGAILPLTGDFSLFGGWLKEGIDFAVAEAQQPVIVVYEDNANQTAKAVSAYRKLISSGRVQAIITARTPVANALAPIANSNRIFTVFTFADLPQGDKTFILNYHFPVADEAIALAEFASKKFSPRGAILVVNDDFGRLGADHFEQHYTRKGGKIVFRDQFSPTERDFRNLLIKLKNTQPSFIFVIAWEQNFLALTKMMKEIGLDLPIIGPNVLTIYLDLVKVYLPTSYFTMSLYDAGKSTGPQYEAFLKNYRAKTGKEPNMVVAEAYEATKILLKALQERPNDLPNFFDKLSEYSGIFGKVIIDNERQAHFPLAVVEIEQGKKKSIVWEFTPLIR
jgi:branched-chain amino acid transport system substrate-binding protein